MTNLKKTHVADLAVGNIVHFYGARFEVKTVARAIEDGVQVYSSAISGWVDGCTMPGYFGPGKDWNFQGDQNVMIEA